MKKPPKEEIKKEIENVEANIKYYSDVHPTKKELNRMNRFLKDLKAEKSGAFTNLEELK